MTGLWKNLEMLIFDFLANQTLVIICVLYYSDAKILFSISNIDISVFSFTLHQNIHVLVKYG